MPDRDNRLLCDRDTVTSYRVVGTVIVTRLDCMILLPEGNEYRRKNKRNHTHELDENIH